ncbi:MAG: FHA domain-containing protein [Bacteroidales bacterium]|nr:FHA domain-containing protein [Bacteroidales bacterium]
MNKNPFPLLVNICITFILCISAQNTQVVELKDILKNPAAYNQEEVEVTGLAIQYVEATEKTTSYYYLKDDYGAIIKVHTAESRPETNVKYNVKGILYIDSDTELPFISERSKSEVVIIHTPIKRKTWLEENWLLVVIIGASALLLILISILLSKRKKGEIPESLETGVKSSLDGMDLSVQKDNLKTMVIPASVPKTMKFIPGELEVLTGDDKGRIIKIGGYPTEEGSIVTIGRERVTGPRDFAHIQLKERTISRRQAEIILKDGKLYIKNLSETNYTKLDGKEIPPNTSAELNAGSVLTFGEVEMKYKI